MVSTRLWRNPKFQSVSFYARLTFLGLVTSDEIDDEGRMTGDPEAIALMQFPGDKVARRDMPKWLDQLAGIGFIVPYEVAGKPYIEVPKFAEHQDSRYKTKSVIPPSPMESTTRRNHPETAGDRLQVKDHDHVEVKELPTPLTPRKRGGDGPPEFEQFWKSYPPSRRLGKPDALHEWKALRLSPDEVSQIMRSLEAWKSSRQWQEEGGRYIPWPQKFLKKLRWQEIPDGLPPVERAERV